MARWESPILPSPTTPIRVINAIPCALCRGWAEVQDPPGIDESAAGILPGRMRYVGWQPDLPRAPWQSPPATRVPSSRYKLQVCRRAIARYAPGGPWYVLRSLPGA